MYEQGEPFEPVGTPSRSQPGQQPPRFTSPGGEEEHTGGKQASVKDVGRKVQRDTTEAMKEEGSAIGVEVRHYIDDLAHDSKERVAERLHHVSEALHRAAEALQQEDEPSSGRIADGAAKQLDRFCRYLHDHEPRDLIDEADRFARRQPALFIGGAVIGGLLLARFLRSSSPHDSEELGRDLGIDDAEQEDHRPARGLAEAYPADAGTVPSGATGGPGGIGEQQPPDRSTQPTRIPPPRHESGPMEGGF